MLNVLHKNPANDIMPPATTTGRHPNLLVNTAGTGPAKIKTRIGSQNVTNAPKCRQSLNGRTNARTNERTDGRTVRFYYTLNFTLGHENSGLQMRCYFISIKSYSPLYSMFDHLLELSHRVNSYKW